MTSAGTTLTVTTISSGMLYVGESIFGTGVSAGTIITAQDSGSSGGAGTYTVTNSQTVPNETMTGTVLNVSSVTNGTLTVLQSVVGSGVSAGTCITALGTGSGDTGTYAINKTQTVSSGPMTADDGGTWIVDANGRRWHRLFNGPVSPRWFGCACDGATNDTTSFSAAVNSGFKVLVDYADIVNITSTHSFSTVTLPIGSVLQVDGEINGAPGNLTAAGSLCLTGNGIISCNNSWQLLIQGGIPQPDVPATKYGEIFISGVRFELTDASETNGIEVVPTGSITSFQVIGCKFKNSVYGIARNPTPGIYCYNAIIEGNVFDTLTGGGVVWNMSAGDARLIIAGNSAYNIIGSVGATFSGIAFDIAGTGPYNDTQMISVDATEIIMSNNVIDTAGQGLHLELCALALISGNMVSNCTSSNTGGSGVVPAGIEVVGSLSVAVTSNNICNCDNGIMWAIGFIGSTPTGSPVHHVTEGNYIYNCSGVGLQTVCCTPAVATVPAFCSVKSNTLELASFIHYGACNLTLDNNTVYTAAGVSQGFIDYTFTTVHYGAAQINYNLQYQLRATDNSFFDALNRTCFTATDIVPSGTLGMVNVVASGNTFSLDNANFAARPIQRTFFTQQTGLSGVPYGYEFQVGDLIIDAATPARYLITAAGSRNAPTDTYTIVSAATGVINAANLSWTTLPSLHTFGQAITLTDNVPQHPAAIPIKGFVGQISTVGSTSQMVVVNAQGLPMSLTTLNSSGTITATNAVAYASV